MKEPIRKISILAHTDDRRQLLEKLRALGLLHLEISETTPAGSAEKLLAQRDEARKALSVLPTPPVLPKNTSVAKANAPTNGTEANAAVKKVRQLSKAAERERAQLETLHNELARLKHWGYYDPKKFEQLREARGLNTRFYAATAKAFKEHDFGQWPHQAINTEKGQVYFVVFWRDEAPELPFLEVHMPKKSNTELEQAIAEHLRDLEKHEAQIAELSGQRAYIEAHVQFIEAELMLWRAHESFEGRQETSIVSLEGWCLVKDLPRVQPQLDKMPLAYLLRQPTKADDIPVVLKNNAYTRLYEPITRIFQLPSYYEFDLTPFIAVFFPIFFAYCLGDAGYGILVLAGAIIGYFTFMQEQRNFAVLGMVLGLMTAFMGILKSGTVFGLSVGDHTDVALLASLANFVFIEGDAEFNVALLLGLVQIVLAVNIAIVRTWRYEGFLAALSPFGKLVIIAAVIVLFLGGMQGVDALAAYQTPAQWGLYVGIGLVFFFHDLEAKLLPRLGLGVLPLFFIFTGILGDILSYVRLFALGVASAVLGLVVNVIGMQIWDAGWFGPVLAIPFFLFGHGLNFALASLGAFVHPLRLTFVEFYNNAGFKGGGKVFKAFS